ncbi:MAG TPA: class I SAM-dependent methyltransferase [Candidatus Omnitrophota bacterium]|nr:class I SAM-dependent methyltransferase [Candidatus Omnitrophota bacterium]HPT07744.1 class I SAM-dependent methyltransferase [Candidatus Omnitrophota bacterium]
MLVKSYRKKGSGYLAQDIDSWTNTWNECMDLALDAASAENDYLSSIFKRYFPLPPKKILEGGCGTGKYVLTYWKKGYDIHGVDFSPQTIERIKKTFGNDTPVSLANITALPFSDGYFDCYYSGGVIEHFEQGPEQALREARRVLKKGGMLLATVPFLNAIRKLRFIVNPDTCQSSTYLKKVVSCSHDAQKNTGFEFCEYYFDIQTLKPFFEKCGFSIETVIPTDFLWGEIGSILNKAISKKPLPAHIKGGTSFQSTIPRGKTQSPRNSIKNFLYEFFVTENRENPCMKIPLTILNHISGHLVLFVAKAV